VCPTVALWNVVGITENVFRITIVPLQRSLDANIVFHCREMEYGRVYRCLVAIQVLDKRLDAALVFKNIFLFSALVNEMDVHTRIEKRQFAQAPGQNLILKLDIGKGPVARLEAQGRTGSFRVTDDRQRRRGLAVHVFLLVGLAFAMNGQDQVL